MMYLVRIDYYPKDGLAKNEMLHRAIARVAGNNIMAVCKQLLGERGDVQDISIEAKISDGMPDCLIVAGRHPDDG